MENSEADRSDLTLLIVFIIINLDNILMFMKAGQPVLF